MVGRGVPFLWASCYFDRMGSARGYGIRNGFDARPWTPLNSVVYMLSSSSGQRLGRARCCSSRLETRFTAYRDLGLISIRSTNSPRLPPTTTVTSCSIRGPLCVRRIPSVTLDCVPEWISALGFPLPPDGIIRERDCSWFSKRRCPTVGALCCTLVCFAPGVAYRCASRLDEGTWKRDRAYL